MRRIIIIEGEDDDADLLDDLFEEEEEEEEKNLTPGQSVGTGLLLTLLGLLFVAVGIKNS